MIEIKPILLGCYSHCTVCAGLLKPKGANVRVIIDAEEEAIAIPTIAHEACAQDIIEFARVHGYAPAGFAEVGARISEEES